MFGITSQSRVTYFRVLDREHRAWLPYRLNTEEDDARDFRLRTANQTERVRMSGWDGSWPVLSHRDPNGRNSLNIVMWPPSSTGLQILGSD
jgi:hypothetical protein